MNARDLSDGMDMLTVAGFWPDYPFRHSRWPLAASALEADVEAMQKLRFRLWAGGIEYKCDDRLWQGQ